MSRILDYMAQQEGRERGKEGRTDGGREVHITVKVNGPFLQSLGLQAHGCSSGEIKVWTARPQTRNCSRGRREHVTEGCSGR